MKFNRRSHIQYSIAGSCALLALIAILQFCGVAVYSDGDSLLYFYPYSILGRLSAIWNGAMLFGIPAAASFQFGYYSPLFRGLHAILGVVSAYSAIITFNCAITTLLFFAFARGIRLSKTAAFFAALAYSLSQFSTHWIGNVSVVGALPVLPAMFFAVQGAFRGKGVPSFLGAMVVGVALLGAHYQFILMSGLLAVTYAVHQWLYLPERRTKAVVLLFAAAALALIIGLPQLRYTKVFSSLSTRVGGLSYGEATVDAALPPDALKAMLPHLSFRLGFSQEFLPYIGVVPLLLALIAIRRKYISDVDVRFFTLTTVVAGTVAVSYSPLFYLMHKLPVLSLFRGPARFSLFIVFALAMLAGYGFDEVRLRGMSVISSRLRRYSSVAVAVVAGIYLFVTALIRFFGNSVTIISQQLFDRYWNTSAGLPIGYYHQVLSRVIQQASSNFDLFSIPAVASLLFLISGVCLLYVKSAQQFLSFGIVFTVCNLIAVGAFQAAYGSPLLLLERSPLASILLTSSRSAPNRYFPVLILTAASQKISAVGGGEFEALRYQMAGLAPNANVYSDIQGADGYEPMAPRRNERVLAYLGSEVNQSFPSLADQPIPLSEKLSTLTSRLNLFSMLNVRWLVSAYELPETSGLSLTASASVTRFNVPIYLYENTSVLPRVYLAHSVTFTTETDEGKLFELITQPGIDFAKQTFIECSNCNVLPSMPKRTDQVDVREYKDGYLRVKATTDIGRWLVFSESNLPGWRITLDGTPTPSYMTNFLFHGVHVPAGEHDIVFEYVGIEMPWPYNH
jgi:hypothetical protein